MSDSISSVDYVRRNRTMSSEQRGESSIEMEARGGEFYSIDGTVTTEQSLEPVKASSTGSEEIHVSGHTSSKRPADESFEARFARICEKGMKIEKTVASRRKIDFTTQSLVTTVLTLKHAKETGAILEGTLQTSAQIDPVQFTEDVEE